MHLVQLSVIRHVVGGVGMARVVIRLGRRVAVCLDGHLLQHRVVRELLTDELDELLARHWQEFNRLEKGRVER